MIGTGDSTTTDFLLVKSYASGAQSWTRTVAKPVPGSVRIALAGPSDPKSITHELGVDCLVDGAIRGTADRMRISVHLADAMKGATVWSEHYDLQVAEVFAAGRHR